MYEQIIKLAQGIKPEYIKIYDIPLYQPYEILNFDWKETQHGSKVIAYLDNNKWFYLPQRFTKFLNTEDPYLTKMNDRNWTIVYKGRQSSNGLAIFELNYYKNC